MNIRRKETMRSVRSAWLCAGLMSRKIGYERIRPCLTGAMLLLFFLAAYPASANIVYKVDQPFTTQGSSWTFSVSESGDYQIGMAWIELTSGSDVAAEILKNGTRVKAFYAPAGEVTRFETRFENLAANDQIMVKATPNGSSYRLGYKIAFATPTFDGLSTFHVADFNAKGDGVTNDRQAIQDAIIAAKDAGGGIVRFDHTKQYRIKGGEVFGIDLTGAHNIKIVGSNPDDPNERAKLLLTSPARVALITDAENIQVEGFIVDYDPLPYFQADVLSADTTNWTVDVRVHDRYPAPETGVGGYVFGRTFVPDSPGARSGSGRHLYVSKIENIPGSTTGRELRVFADLENGTEWKTKAAVEDCATGKATEVIMRTRNGTSGISYTFIIAGNSRVLVSNVRFYRVPSQGILPQNNHGPVTIRDVDFLMPDANEDPVFNRNTELFVSWRGHYLTRNNRFGVLFDGGKHDGGAMYDDLYNGHVHLANVTAVNGDEVSCSINRSADNWAVGDWVSVWNYRQTIQHGVARLKSVPDGKPTAIKVTLDRPVPGIVTNDTTLVNEDLMNRGTVVRNWRTYTPGAGNASFRLHTPVLFEDCHFDNSYFWAYTELHREGPRPQGIVFRNTYIHGGEEPMDMVKTINMTLEGCTVENGRLHCHKGAANVYLKDMAWTNQNPSVKALKLRESSTVYLYGDSMVNGSTNLPPWVEVDATSTIHYTAP